MKSSDHDLHPLFRLGPWCGVSDFEAFHLEQSVEILRRLQAVVDEDPTIRVPEGSLSPFTYDLLKKNWFTCYVQPRVSMETIDLLRTRANGYLEALLEAERLGSVPTIIDGRRKLYEVLLVVIGRQVP